MSESVLFIPRHPFNSAPFPTRHRRRRRRPLYPPPPPGLLCAAVIGTDVPLASHRATFPLIATLYASSFHLPPAALPFS